jgi:Flp pilus assembly pilin Flp
MGMHMPFSEFFAFLSVLMIAVFSFVSIAVWVEGRRKEREAYYKAESLRRITEMPAESAAQVIAMLQEEERLRYNHELDNEWKKLAGIKLGGLINIAVGTALTLLIYCTSENRGASMVGLIPGLIGVALLIYAYFMVPQPRA